MGGKTQALRYKKRALGGVTVIVAPPYVSADIILT
jgi:hypothetical protein